MSNNPIISHEYIEIVTAEDLLSVNPSDRANKIVATDGSGIIPAILIPSQVTVSSITVGAQTVEGAVTFTTPSGSAITITANDVTNTISFSTTAVSSINNLTAGISIRGGNNLYFYTDVATNTITISDDLISPPANDTEISQVIKEFTTDVNGRVSTVVSKEVRGITTNTLKTTSFAYDTKGRLTTETISFSSGRIITTTYAYPASGSGLPEEIPLSYTKTIS